MPSTCMLVGPVPGRTWMALGKECLEPQCEEHSYGSRKRRGVSIWEGPRGGVE